MFSPDKNDVNISKLFTWCKDFDLDTTEGTIKIYMRLVGDADLNLARVYSLRHSAELRKKLKDLDSDERVAYIADKEILSKEELVNYALLEMTRQFTLEATKEVTLPFPKEPDSDAPLEKLEKYQKELDTYKDRLSVEIEKKVRIRVERERKHLDKLSFDELYNNYATSVINSLCEMEMYTRFKEFNVYSACYKDPDFKEKLFNSVEEFGNLPKDIKEQFIQRYEGLEIDIDELKK